MKIQLIFKNSRSIVIYVIYDRKTRCRDFTRGYFPTMMMKYRNFNVEMQKKNQGLLWRNNSDWVWGSSGEEEDNE